MTRKKDPETGLFVMKDDRPRVQKSLMLSANGVEALQNMKAKNESLSDKVNEAIALYLQNQQKAEVIYGD